LERGWKLGFGQEGQDWMGKYNFGAIPDLWIHNLSKDSQQEWQPRISGGSEDKQCLE
jgi:hypothetical protein